MCESLAKNEIVECPHHFFPLGEKCYFLGRNKVNHHQALKACKAKNAKLAEPRTRKESDLIIAFASKVGLNFYLGMNDIAKEGRYEISD